MTSDPVTFFAAFTALFLAIGAYLWKLERDAQRLAFRLQVLEESDSSDATAKNPDP